MLDNFIMGGPISDHSGVRCCPAMENETDEKYIVKVISIPASPSQMDALLLTGAYPDEASVLSYFSDLTEVVLEEIRTLDSLAEQEEFRNKYKSRENLVALRPEARIDLHGLTKEGAWQRLESFISECEAKKIKKVLIIHGKGIHSHGSDPVLGEVVRKFIEIDKRLGSSGHPDSSMGGKGATWVILKNNIFR